MTKSTRHLKIKPMSEAERAMTQAVASQVAVERLTTTFGVYDPPDQDKLPPKKRGRIGYVRIAPPTEAERKLFELMEYFKPEPYYDPED